jgi:hypothetical protein
MTKQDKIKQGIMQEIDKLCSEEYTGKLELNFTTGKVSNRCGYKNSKVLVDLNAETCY